MRTPPQLRARFGQTPVQFQNFPFTDIDNLFGAGTAPLLPPKPLYGDQGSAKLTTHLLRGLFGAPPGDPRSQLSSQVRKDTGSGGPNKYAGPNRGPDIYQYQMGDLFTPGTQNFVFEYPFELPMFTIWGNAFLRQPNTFQPLQPPQVYSNQTVRLNGIGGLVAGTVALQPLESNGD